MDFFAAMQVSASGLTAQRTRMNVASSNLANVSTTRTPDGGPYKRRDVVLETDSSIGAVGGQPPQGSFAESVKGVKVAQVVEDASPPALQFDPGHPDADVDGYVAYPNVNVVEEMVDMITASRAYQAGLTTLKAATKLATAALQIGRG